MTDKNHASWFYLLLIVISGFSSVAQTTVNAYAKITAVSGSSVLTLSNVDQTNHTFTVGGQVIVMQMQDDVIGSNTTNISTFGNLSSIANAGNYEIKTIAAITPTSGTPTSLTLTSVLANTYNTGANSSVQLISFRDLGANYTTSANISGNSWNGNVGGVVAFYVTNTLTLNHRILADGIGFRGGLYSNNNGGAICTSNSNTLYIANDNQLGFKGEGIYKNTNNNFNNARGRLLNGGGGGNDHNAGGGGGGNFSAGGQGGNGYNDCTTFPGGGLGGVSLSAQISASRVFMGGAGGGGQQNNSQNSAGGNGGGIILIKANAIATSSTCGSSIRITASGLNANSAGNDGMGGGGAGGSIVLQVPNFSVTSTCPLLVRSNGGNGGSVSDAQAHGGGGGGGQGVVIYSIPIPTTNITTQVNNGVAGSDNSGGSTSAGNGAGSSGTGTIASASGPLPVKLMNFDGLSQINNIKLLWQTATEKNNSHFVIEKSNDALDFTVLATVKGAGNSSIIQRYELSDFNPVYGINYYRLKQVDFDGTSTTSPLIAVNYADFSEIKIYPNPLNTSESLFLEFGKIEQSVEITLFDLAGKPVHHEVVDVLPNQQIELKSLHLEKGIYQVKINLGAFGYKMHRLIIN